MILVDMALGAGGQGRAQNQGPFGTGAGDQQQMDNDNGQEFFQAIHGSSTLSRGGLYSVSGCQQLKHLLAELPDAAIRWMTHLAGLKIEPLELARGFFAYRDQLFEAAQLE